MWRIIFGAALAVAIGTSGTALAQSRSGKDDVKKLEAELDKLRSQLKDLEALLQKAKEDKRPEAPPGAFGPRGPKGPDFTKKKGEDFGGKGFGRMGPSKMAEMREQFEKMRNEAEKKGDGKMAEKRPATPGGPFGPWGRMDPSQMKKKMDEFGGKGFGPMGPSKMMAMREMFEKMWQDSQKKGDRKDSRRSASSWRDRGGSYWRGSYGRDSRRLSEGSRSSDIERRLDRILREVEDLRREIRRK